MRNCFWSQPEKRNCFAYPRLFSEGAILPIIRLEIGALAAWTPTQEATITSFAAEQYPQVFLQPGTSLRTVSPERTFWEKVTILHKEAFRTNGKIPPRYSRHYYCDKGTVLLSHSCDRGTVLLSHQRNENQRST